MFMVIGSDIETVVGHSFMGYQLEGRASTWEAGLAPSEHCVHLPNQELVSFMDNAKLNMVVPLKNRKPHLRPEAEALYFSVSSTNRAGFLG